jgi:Uma2 family endonuclease
MATIIIPTANQLITGEEYALMDVPDHYELVRGRIVPMPQPSFDHGTVEANITGEVYIFLKTHRLGRLCGGEAGVYTKRNPDTVRGTDMMYITNERLAKRDTTLRYPDVAPDWITEVLSPSNTKPQVDEKLEEYFAIDVRMVWLADPDARCVHVYRSMTDIRTFHEPDTITGEDVLPGFSVQVAQIFENL